MKRSALLLLLLSGCVAEPYAQPYGYRPMYSYEVPLPVTAGPCTDNPYAPPYPFYNPNECTYGAAYHPIVHRPAPVYDFEESQ